MSTILDQANKAEHERQVGIGHNAPDMFDETKSRAEDLIAVARKWINERGEIANQEHADKANDFITQLTKAEKAAEDARKNTNEPYRAAIKANDTRFKAVTEPLTVAKAKLREMLKPWLDKLDAERRERERKAREEAEAAQKAADEAAEKAMAGEGDFIDNSLAAAEAQKKAEEAQKAAERASREKTQVKGDFSERARGFRTVWKAEVVDPDRFAVWLLMQDDLRDDIMAELTRRGNAIARGGRRKVPGLRIFNEKVVQ